MVLAVGSVLVLVNSLKGIDKIPEIIAYATLHHANRQKILLSLIC